MTMFKRTSRKDAKPDEAQAEPSDKAAAKQAKAAAKSEKAAAKLAKRAEKRAKSVAESRAKSAEPQVYRKPRADIYTVMLSIALITVAIAATALWMTMNEYNKMINGGPQPTWNRPAAPASFDPPREVV
jgi:hypothetical protein